MLTEQILLAHGLLEALSVVQAVRLGDKELGPTVSEFTKRNFYISLAGYGTSVLLGAGAFIFQHLGESHLTSELVKACFEEVGMASLHLLIAGPREIKYQLTKNQVVPDDYYGPKVELSRHDIATAMNLGSLSDDETARFMEHLSRNDSAYSYDGSASDNSDIIIDIDPE